MQTITNKPIKFKNMTRSNSLPILTFVNRSTKSALLLALFILAATSFSFANNSNAAGSFAKGIMDSNGTATAHAAYSPDLSTDAANRKVRLSFKQDFKNARLLSSEVHTHFTKLTFRMNDMVLFAYYADNGKLLAVVRNILSSQLPTDLQADLKSSYGDYWITELFELNGEGQNCYYISLENADTKLVLRSTGDNTWEVYQQTDKN
jgi:hypothetical protein